MFLALLCAGARRSSRDEKEKERSKSGKAAQWDRKQEVRVEAGLGAGRGQASSARNRRASRLPRVRTACLHACVLQVIDGLNDLIQELKDIDDAIASQVGVGRVPAGVAGRACNACARAALLPMLQCGYEA